MKRRKAKAQAARESRAVDGSPLGRQILLQEMESGAAHLDKKPVMLLRLTGIGREGQEELVTLGITEADVDKFLGKVQEAVRSFKSEQARRPR